MNIISEATRKLIKQLDPKENDLAEVSFSPEKQDTFRIKLYNEQYDGLAHAPKGWYFRKFPAYLVESKLVDARKQSWNQRDWWDVPITDTNCELLSEMLDLPGIKDHIIWTEGTELEYASQKVKAKIEDSNATVIGNWRKYKLLPLTTLSGEGEHPVYPLKDFQKVCRHNMLTNDGYANFGKQGTGKTPTTISAIMYDIGAKRREDPDYFYRALIVCPNAVRFNWKEEFKKFSTRPGNVKVIRGSRHDREAELLLHILDQRDRKHEFCAIIVGYATLARSLHAFLLESVAGYPINAMWDFGVCDESQFIKNPKADRTKAALSVRNRCRRRAILSGSPLTNNLLDLQPQLEFLSHGGSGFSTYDAYKSFYGNYRLDDTTNGKKVLEFHNIPLLQERLAKLAFIIDKEEALPWLPSKVYDIIESNMSIDQLARYKEVATRVRLEVEKSLTELEVSGKTTHAMTIQNILVKLLRLAQVASGFCKYDDEFDEDGNLIQEGHTEFFEYPGIKQLMELLKEKEETEKTIVWSCFTNNVLQLFDEYEGPGHAVKYYGGMTDDEKEQSVHSFNNDPECRVLFGNPASGGTGLNLVGYDTSKADEYETNCNHIIYFSENWNSNHRTQSEDRAHRNSTRVQVRISTILTPGSIQEEIHTRVQAKISNAELITDVKSIISQIMDGIDTIDTNGE